MSNAAVKVENLSKLYRIGMREKRHDTLSSALTAWLKSPWSNYRRLRKLTHFDLSAVGPRSAVLPDDLVWALKDVSFEVKQGEVIGIIGPNGAGKSTLLKILSRITEPTGGRAIINGRVASLLEVGTGFHAELTGRENIYLSGTILGMTKKEVDKKFDAIVDFAETEKFIDTPVKHYSSGMYVRLAFAVAAHLDPDILVVDEVLAVGDIEFQQKCIGRMGDVAKGGRTVLFVSHNMGAVAKLCGKSFLLDHGRLVSGGPSNEIIEQYLSNVLRKDASPAESAFALDPDKRMQITAMRIMQDNGARGNVFDRALPFKIVIEYEVNGPTDKASIEMVLETVVPKHTYVLFSLDTDLDPERRALRQAGRYISTITFPGLILNAGAYQIRAWIWKSEAKETYDTPDTALQFHLYDGGTEKAIAMGGRKDSGVLGIPLKWDTEMVSGAIERPAEMSQIRKTVSRGRYD